MAATANASSLVPTTTTGRRNSPLARRLAEDLRTTPRAMVTAIDAPTPAITSQARET